MLNYQIGLVIYNLIFLAKRISLVARVFINQFCINTAYLHKIQSPKCICANSINALDSRVPYNEICELLQNFGRCRLSHQRNYIESYPESELVEFW